MCAGGCFKLYFEPRTLLGFLFLRRFGEMRGQIPSWEPLPTTPLDYQAWTCATVIV